MAGRTFVGMPMRTAILAGILLAALAAYLATAPPEREVQAVQPEQAERPSSILPCDPEDVGSIRVDGEGVTVTGVRSADGWNVSGPGANRWTATALDGVAAALCGLPVLDRIEAAGPTDPYGLAEPVARVRVRVGDAAHIVRVGSLSPAGTRAYVQVDGGDVLVVGSMLRSELDKLPRAP